MLTCLYALSKEINTSHLLPPASTDSSINVFSLQHHPDLNHIIGVSIWVPDWPRGPQLDTLTVINDSVLSTQRSIVRSHHQQPVMSLSHFVSGFFFFYIFMLALLFCIHAYLPLSPQPPFHSLLFLCLSALPSIIVLQEHAEAGGGVQRGRALGDPRGTFQSRRQVKGGKQQWMATAFSATVSSSFTTQSMCCASKPREAFIHHFTCTFQLSGVFSPLHHFLCIARGSTFLILSVIFPSRGALLWFLLLKHHSCAQQCSYPPAQMHPVGRRNRWNSHFSESYVFN